MRRSSSSTRPGGARQPSPAFCRCAHIAARARRLRLLAHMHAATHTGTRGCQHARGARSWPRSSLTHRCGCLTLFGTAQIGSNVGACSLHMLLTTDAQIIAFEPGADNLHYATRSLLRLANEVQVFSCARVRARTHRAAFGSAPANSAHACGELPQATGVRLQTLSDAYAYTHIRIYAYTHDTWPRHATLRDARLLCMRTAERA